MSVEPQELAKRVLRREWSNLSPSERRVIEHVLHRAPITRDTNEEFREARTFSARAADGIAAFGGSWAFVLGFIACLAAWIGLNSLVLARARAAFDPFPYILLNLFLSMMAALQAPIILMSQNRHNTKDRLDAAHDYEVNLKSEIEIRGLHEKLDALRERDWAELVLMQQQQIRLLEQLLAARPPVRAGAPPAEGSAGGA
ncbi:MAG TPA: DUF1003 domain-containing protein [Longimicrobiales bacterium]|nr:DUF1003 domain-containing protein [Longimicrobiales bacterium]